MSRSYAGSSDDVPFFPVTPSTIMAMKRYASVDAYVQGLEHWQPEVTRLREVLRSTDLEETLKWSAPCYVYQGKNLIGIGAFQGYFGVWFFQGTQMEDPDGVLINAQEGKTKALRQWRMTTLKEIKVRQLKKYVQLAKNVIDQGAEIKPDRSQPVVIDPLLRAAFQENKSIAKKFKSLTPGRQREYADHVSEAKRDETKLRRIAKILPMIEAGVGLHDKYRNC